MKNKLWLLVPLAMTMVVKYSYGQQVLPLTADRGSAKTLVDDTHHVFVYGIGGAESLELKNISASGTLNAGLLLGWGMTANLTFNFGATAVKKENADSVPLSLFYFPDVSNTAFAMGLDKKIGLGPYSNLVPYMEGSIQRRNIEKDSLTYDFGIVNANGGLKYRWVYEQNQHKTVFTAGLSFNYVAINKNNTDAFNTLFYDYVAPEQASIRRSFSGVCLMASLQLDDAIVFARTYDDVNRGGTLAFTVGIKAAATFFSF